MENYKPIISESKNYKHWTDNKGQRKQESRMRAPNFRMRPLDFDQPEVAFNPSPVKKMRP